CPRPIFGVFLPPFGADDAQVLMRSDDRPALVGQPSREAGMRLRRFLPLVVVAAAAAIVFAMGWHRHLSLDTLVRHHSVLAAFVAAHYALAIAAFIATYIAVVALSVPGATVLTITAGILFGWLVGGLAAIVG